MEISREWTRICKPAIWLEKVGILQAANAPYFFFTEFTQEVPVGSFLMDIGSIKTLRTALHTISSENPSIKLNLTGYTMAFEKSSLVALEFTPYHWKRRIVFRFQEPYRNWSFALNSDKHARIFNELLSMVERRYSPEQSNSKEKDTGNA